MGGVRPICYLDDNGRWSGTRPGRGDPFREDSLPRAILRFKQCFGRLVRSAEDRGRVVILDPRVLSTGYGRAFLKALPEGVEIRTIPEQS